VRHVQRPAAISDFVQNCVFHFRSWAGGGAHLISGASLNSRLFSLEFRGAVVDENAVALLEGSVSCLSTEKHRSPQKFSREVMVLADFN
jgi:hypothetical protein